MCPLALTATRIQYLESGSFRVRVTGRSHIRDIYNVFKREVWIEQPEAIPREMSSRSAKVSAHRERRRAAGGIPPRGNNTARMQLCGLSKARPISCSDSPAFQRLQTSRFSIAESPNRIPGLMPTPPLQRRFTSDGVASTYRMHRFNRTLDSMIA